MIKLFYPLLFSIITFTILGCSNEYKEELLKEELREDLNSSKNPLLSKSKIETLEVDAEHFKILQADIPDKEQIKQVKILGAKLDDVIALITEATDEDIIFQLQSDNINNSAQYGNNLANINAANTARTNINNNTNNSNENYDETQIRESKVYVSASNIGFGRLLKKAVELKKQCN